MPRRMLLIAVSVLSLIVLTAGSALAAPKPVGKEFTLKVGESARIGREGLTVTFVGVQSDSRCPANAICIWEGNAEVAVMLSMPPHDPAKAILNTSASLPQNTIYQNYDLRLKRLEPYPMSVRPIQQRKYRATFVVTRPIITTKG